MPRPFEEKVLSSISVRALANPEEIAKRRSLLSKPHMAKLTDWVAGLRKRFPDQEFPDFDPLGGGVASDMLFLKEKPGPRTSRIGGGSGFVSVDNNDPTAEAARRFLHAAAIDHARTCNWNLIPGWDQTIRYRARDWQSGLPLLFELLELLPALRVIILAGKVAQRAKGDLEAADYTVVCSAHTSIRVRNGHPDLWSMIPVRWAEAKAIADGT